MKVVIQRVTYSNLSIDNKIYSQIKRGLVVLLGITHYDDDNDIEWLAKKIVNLRIFNDDKNIMNNPWFQAFLLLIGILVFLLKLFGK